MHARATRVCALNRSRVIVNCLERSPLVRSGRSFLPTNLMEQNHWYSRYRFSVTCRTSDVGVVFCLRGLCEWAEEGRFPNIGRGGTTRDDWEKSGGKSTFRFTDPAYRKRFLDKATELLYARWAVIEQSDDDPAYRHGKPH
jgi:hypothetical protein